MPFFNKFLCCFLLLTAGSVSAQSMQELEACQSVILESETDYNADIYSECGFDDLQLAVAYWAPLALQNKWGNALYEIYKRHPDYPNVKQYLYQAADAGQADALVITGNELLDQGKVAEAMRSYNLAIRGDLDEATQGSIAGRVALLYADPNGGYYDIDKALPLLKKAALQRHALSNNVLGMLSLFGQGGMPQNAEESFKYFWRSILLGCPAAEENLGFFLLARDKKIDNATLQREILARTYSCDAVAATTVNYPLYHLTFTPQQCSDLNYYAQRLVDTSLPFTGKKECIFSADMGAIADFLSK